MNTKVPKIIKTKFITEISSCIKIELNGNEQKNVQLQQNKQNCIRFVENTYKLGENEFSKLEFEIRVKNKDGKIIYTFARNELIKIYNRLCQEGKLTLIMEKPGLNKKDEYKIFLYKSAPELIEHFLSKLNSIPTQTSSDQIKKPKFSEIEESKSTNISTSNQKDVSKNNNKNNIHKRTLPIKTNDNKNIINSSNNINNNYNIKNNNEINVNNNNSVNISTNNNNDNNKNNKYRKRKYNELINQQRKEKNTLKRNIIALNTADIKIKNAAFNEDIERIKNSYNFTDYLSKIFPDYLSYQILKYLDKRTILFKASTLNKEIKKIADSYIDNIRLSDETPKEIISKILSRFPNTKTIILGKAKNFKNFHIKEIFVTLRYLQHFDISSLENINDENIRKFLSKTRGVNVLTLKLNAFLDSLHEALCYCLSFYKNMNELSVVNNHFRFDENGLKFLMENPRYYRKELTTTINRILDSKFHKIKKLNYFLFNGIVELYTKSMFKGAYIENKIYPFPFKNLLELGIDCIIIKEVKELQIFYKCEQLIKFKLGEIIIKNDKKENEINYIDIDKIHDEQLMNQNNCEVDFDNEPTEVFGKIFYYMRNIKEISFGGFLTNDICQLISVYLKKIEKFSFSSPNIDDMAVREIFIRCKNVKEINLEGCSNFNGSCFMEMNNSEFPTKLVKARFSLTGYNYYKLIAYLRNKGIEAFNYIRK